MKIKRLNVELAKAQGQFAKAKKAVKATVTRSASLKAHARDSKRAFKESRRTYKQVRGFLKTATQEERQAEKDLKKASARLERLRAKMKKLHSVPAKTSPKRKRPQPRKPAARSGARSAVPAVTKQSGPPTVMQTSPAQTPQPTI